MNTHLNRRTFLKTSAVATAGTLMGATAKVHAARTSQAKRPNILVIITDQQNIDTLSAYRDYFKHPAHGTQWVHTPHLDRMAQSGFSFLESHAPNPVCGPDRSCFLTGRYSTETGVVVNNTGIDKKVPTIGQWLSSQSDYNCYYAGKWHASGPWNYPTLSGKHTIDGWNVIPVGGTSCGDFNDFGVSMATQAFLRNYKESEPFVYVAGLMNPHDICYWITQLNGRVITPNRDYLGLGDERPILPPNNKYDFADPKAEKQRQSHWNEDNWRNYAYDYYRMIERVDSDVGRMLDALEDRDDETIVIFTSDHGEGLGRHERVQKWHPFEESVKVPFVVMGKNMVNENVVDQNHLVSALDIMPTICDYAGVAPPPNCRGRSLRPLVEGREPDQWRDSVMCEFQVGGRVLRTERYKYVQFYETRNGRKDHKWYIDAKGNRVRFNPKQIDSYTTLPERMLFDIKADPWEMNNLADDSRYADIMEDHRKLLLEQYDSRMIPGTPHTYG